jgi:hypothetical protein
MLRSNSSSTNSYAKTSTDKRRSQNPCPRPKLSARTRNHVASVDRPEHFKPKTRHQQAFGPRWLNSTLARASGRKESQPAHRRFAHGDSGRREAVAKFCRAGTHGLKQGPLPTLARRPRTMRPSGSGRKISWDQWFRKFDQSNLAFLYQDETASGNCSRFFKLVKRSGSKAWR